jgi:hypothetical protein
MSIPIEFVFHTVVRHERNNPPSVQQISLFRPQRESCLAGIEFHSLGRDVVEDEFPSHVVLKHDDSDAVSCHFSPRMR